MIHLRRLSPLACALGHAATSAVSAALVALAAQRVNRFLALTINAEQEIVVKYRF